jgi:hypothetical protein
MPLFVLPFIHYVTFCPYYATIHNAEEKYRIIWMKNFEKKKMFAYCGCIVAYLDEKLLTVDESYPCASGNHDF